MASGSAACARAYSGSSSRGVFAVRGDSGPYASPFDLGGGHRIEWYQYDGSVVGGVIYHPAPGGECGGSFWLAGSKLAPQGHSWQVVLWSPLTLTPSFRCHCGYHGWVRGGKWVRV